jgi:hypothetical protein
VNLELVVILGQLDRLDVTKVARAASIFRLDESDDSGGNARVAGTELGSERKGESVVGSAIENDEEVVASRNG